MLFSGDSRSLSTPSPSRLSLSVFYISFSLSHFFMLFLVSMFSRTTIFSHFHSKLFEAKIDFPSLTDWLKKKQQQKVLLCPFLYFLGGKEGGRKCWSGEFSPSFSSQPRLHLRFFFMLSSIHKNVSEFVRKFFAPCSVFCSVFCCCSFSLSVCLESGFFCCFFKLSNCEPNFCWWVSWVSFRSVDFFLLLLLTLQN